MRYNHTYLEGLLNSDDVLDVFELDAIIMSGGVGGFWEAAVWLDDAQFSCAFVFGLCG